jgi:CRISPR/Cas system CSM-associated protein Csm2 small subunit
MGNMEDALKRAGLGAEGEAAPEPPAAEDKPAEEAAAPAAEAAEAPAAVEAPPEAAAPAAPAAPAAAEAQEQPCAQCGTPFVAKHPRHRLCDKCAGERQAARAQSKPAPRPEIKPATSAAGETMAETRACAKCGTAFTPRHPRHRLCDKCAAEAPPREPRPPREARPSAEARPVRDARTTPETALPARPVARLVRREPLPARRVSTVSAGVPPDYLAGGYFTAGARGLRDELYLDWAQQWAELLVLRRLSSAQLRAFYNHVRRAAASLEAGGDAQQARAQVLRIPGFAAARVGRPGFPLEFREFLDRNIEQVKDAASLRAFADHFQAVVGYTAGRLRN